MPIYTKTQSHSRRCLHQDTKSLIPIIVLLFVVCLFVCLFVMNALGKATAQHLDIQFKCMLWSWKKQRCRDGVMSDFVSWCRHLLVPLFS